MSQLNECMTGSPGKIWNVNKGMNTPKNQQQLLLVIQEQDKQIQSLRQAMIRLERKMMSIAMLAERNQGKTHRLREENQVLTEHIRIINAKLGG